MNFYQLYNILNYIEYVIDIFIIVMFIYILVFRVYLLRKRNRNVSQNSNVEIKNYSMELGNRDTTFSYYRTPIMLLILYIVLIPFCFLVKANMVGHIVGSFLIVLALITFIILYIRRKKDIEMINDSIKLLGKIKLVKKSFINGKYIIYGTYVYNNEEHLFKSQTINLNVSFYIREYNLEKIPIYVSKRLNKRVIVDLNFFNPYIDNIDKQQEKSIFKE